MVILAAPPCPTYLGSTELTQPTVNENLYTIVETDIHIRYALHTPKDDQKEHIQIALRYVYARNTGEIQPGLVNRKV